MKSPKNLKTLGAGKPPWPAIDVDKAIPWVEQRTKLALADSQKAALRVALVSNVMVITGGRGVGKNPAGQLTAEDSDRHTVTIALSTPTGRTAKRQSESSGLEAKTIHLLLETAQGPAASGAMRTSPWTVISRWSTRYQRLPCR
jgi:exodeoxyribonuclease V alpha subunit